LEKALNDGIKGIKGQYVVIDEGVTIGEGTSIWNLVYIGAHARIGANVTVASLVHIAAEVVVEDDSMIEANACIGHLAKIGRRCFIGPGVVINADPFPPVRKATGVAAWHGVKIEDEAIIGARAIINAGVVVGRGAVVGMGAVVISDVPPGTVVMGSPARPIYRREEYDLRQQEWVAQWEKNHKGSR
jgi:acetyltransferase-like isoleucine patch superfamily enzyme